MILQGRSIYMYVCMYVCIHQLLYAIVMARTKCSARGANYGVLMSFLARPIQNAFHGLCTHRHVGAK